MHEYRVGQRYHLARGTWPEGAQYNYRQGQHELLLFFKWPTAREIEAVRVRDAEFGVYAHEDLVVLLYQFGSGVRWSDAPYSWHLVPAEQRNLPPVPDEEERAFLHVILVDASTGVIRAMRAVTFSPAFTRVLHAAIRDQAARPFDAARYDQALKRLYRQYPTTETLLAAANARTRGGA